MTYNIQLLALLAILLFGSSCTNNSLETEAQFDCSVSDLKFTHVITDADCGQSNGAITLTVTGGLPPYSFVIDGSTSQLEGVFNDLVAGNYMVTVLDQNNCEFTQAITVAATGGFQATATVNSSGCKTSNGSITVQPVNGTAPYKYQITGGVPQSNAMFTNLSSGEYEVLITDASGCDFSIIKTIESGISYNSSVKSIIANTCATTNCHDGSTSQTNFTIFSNVQSKASSIKSRTQNGSMPKNGTLTQAQKDAIACWVDDGAKNN